MSYIGIVGPYSTGKTTATDAILEFDLSAVTSGCVTVVNCDNCRERWVDGDKVVTNKNLSWQAAVAVKHATIEAVALNTDILTICETAWTDHITGAAKVPSGVIAFYVLTVKPDVMRQFIQERCALRGKEFRVDYWDDKRLLYEGSNRPLNAAARYLTPAGINWYNYQIGSTRIVWDDILDSIWHDIERW